MKKFSVPGSKTASNPSKSPEEVRGEEEVEGVDKQPGAWGGGEGAKGKYTKRVGKG